MAWRDARKLRPIRAKTPFPGHLLAAIPLYTFEIFLWLYFHFTAILAKIDMQDKAETCIAFTHLTSFVIDIMNRAYSQKSSDIRFAGSPMTRRRIE